MSEEASFLAAIAAQPDDDLAFDVVDNTLRRVFGTRVGLGDRLGKFVVVDVAGDRLEVRHQYGHSGTDHPSRRATRP